MTGPDTEEIAVASTAHAHTHTDVQLNSIPPPAEPVIGFSKSIYNVLEPKTEDESTVVSITVERSGDSNKQSVVRFYTKDGNAQSGKDYNPISKGKTRKQLAVLKCTRWLVITPLIYRVPFIHAQSSRSRRATPRRWFRSRFFTIRNARSESRSPCGWRKIRISSRTSW